MGELWLNLADKREKALATRGMQAEQKWTEHTRPLTPLKVGDHVMVQNQRGNHPLPWDKRGKVIQCEGFDQYQVMIDGSRRLTRRNRKYLRLFTPYRPVSSVPPAAETKAVIKMQRPILPGHVQQETQPEKHGGNVYKQLHECPRQGTVNDLLDWAIPTAEGGKDEGPEGHAHGDEPRDGEQHHDEEVAEPYQEVSSPRRSTRAGRGQTNKYEDCVRQIGASATYAQIVSGMGGRGHSW